MSPPDSSPEKQAKRHSPLLIGIIAAICIAVIAFLGVLMFGPEDEPTVMPPGEEEPVAAPE